MLWCELRKTGDLAVAAKKAHEDYSPIVKASFVEQVPMVSRGMMRGEIHTIPARVDSSEGYLLAFKGQ